MADTADAGETKDILRLTVKEKLLIELGEHNCERDKAEYPIELTQKGLSDSLGVRRSHVAMSLQALTEEKLAEPMKARIESEKRRQNIYLLTPAGCQRAKELKESVLAVMADFEMPEGVRRTSAGDFLKKSRASLASVVNQLGRGGLVRDEITIVTRPERKLISVFCPTCKRNIEVENIFVEEEVGFDCPGCGRPYRIAPAERVVARVQAGGYRELWFAFLLLIIIVGGYAFYKETFRSSTAGALVTASVVVLLTVVAYLGLTINWRALSHGYLVSAKIVVSSVVFGVAFVLLWNFVISSINFRTELMWFGPVVFAIAFGYVGTRMTAPNLRGEYQLAAGALVLLIGVSTLFIDDLQGLTIDSAPFLGVLGVTLIVLSTLTHTERNLEVLSVILASGVFIVIVSISEALPSSGDVLGTVTVTGFLVLSALMISLRLLQHTSPLPLGEVFASALPLAAGALFVTAGVFMIGGGSTLAGLIEIGLMLPFLYFGVKKVFDGLWMYRLPIASYLVFLEILASEYALMT